MPREANSQLVSFLCRLTTASHLWQVTSNISARVLRNTSFVFERSGLTRGELAPTVCFFISRSVFRRDLSQVLKLPRARRNLWLPPADSWKLMRYSEVQLPRKTVHLVNLYTVLETFHLPAVSPTPWPDERRSLKRPWNSRAISPSTLGLDCSPRGNRWNWERFANHRRSKWNPQVRLFRRDFGDRTIFRYFFHRSFLRRSDRTPSPVLHQLDNLSFLATIG